MNIGDAAERSGLPAKTIRYYEDIRLLKPARGENGYRDYSNEDVHRLRFLQRSRSLGFSVEECRQLLSLYGDKGGIMVHTDGRKSSLQISAGSDVDKLKWREVKTPAVPTTYQRFAKALRSGQNGDPSFRRAADIQRVLDLVLEGGDKVVEAQKKRR